MSGSVILNIPDDGYASYRMKHMSRDLEMHIDSSGNVGLYENSHNSWLIVQRTDRTVEIPHNVMINGLHAVGSGSAPCTIMAPSQFIQLYGGELPAQYGTIFIHGYSRPGSFSGDTYYWLMNVSQEFYIGHQVNGETSITWERLLGTNNVKYSNGVLDFYL